MTTEVLNNSVADKALNPQKFSIFSFTLKELEDFMESQGEKKFRARQLFKWVYAKKTYDLEQMTDLAVLFRTKAKEWFHFNPTPIVDHRISKDGTQKFLFSVGDGLTVETVMIPMEGTNSRKTLCVSSEVGCNLGCKFCFTGKQKLKKRLGSEHIVSQFVEVNRILEEQGHGQISNIVFMGMGEPLDNPEGVFGFIDIVTDPIGIQLSKKRITVSTSGIVPLIPMVTESGARLAVSLNGTTDRIRSQIMPINNKWNMATLIEACRENVKESGSPVTFEYVLLKGVTDSLEDAHRLFEISKTIDCKFNLIPFNEHPDSGFIKPDADQVEKFQRFLYRKGVHVLLRKTRGDDIFAACGQLNSTFEGHPDKLSV